MPLKHHAFRVYVDLSAFDSTVAFYEQLQATTCERRISIAGVRIEVAVVGAFIVLGGSADDLAPFRPASALLVLDSLDATLAWACDQGAEVLHGPQDAPGGRNAMVRHPDGLIAEYYERVSL
jgi:predicted enzyme related to lactoylglutathione lyase